MALFDKSSENYIENISRKGKSTGREISRTEYFALCKKYRKNEKSGKPYTELRGSEFDELCLPSDIPHERVSRSGCGYDIVFVEGDYSRELRELNCRKYFPDEYEEAVKWDDETYKLALLDVLSHK